MLLGKVNKVIRILILSDFYVLAGFGFITPIFAIFITQQITGGDIRVVGFAAATYWIVKSILQIPIGIWLDKHGGERDDLYFLILGTIIAGLVPFGYIFCRLPWHIYSLQAVYSLGMALAIPAWGGIFTRHIDKGKEAMEWSMESTALGIGMGISGGLGGVLAVVLGFDKLFIVTGIIVIIGGLIPILLYKGIKQAPKTDQRMIREKQL